MRTITPRATPVVRAPSPSTPPTERQLPPPLRAPVTLITPGTGDVELHEGSLLIGRLPECDVVCDDALVSRMHARISVRGQSVIVEDMHSTNGVYVNGIRITRSVLLREGDRLLTGTTEISLFEARGSARITPLRVRREDEPTVPGRPQARGPAASTLPLDQSAARFGTPQFDVPPSSQRDEASSETRISLPSVSRAAELAALRSRAAAVPSTTRADALEVIGALADRLAASGNLEEARRVLSSHLKRILHGATAGLTVPAEVCGLASRHALSLARWGGQSAWIDFVVELHLAARLSMDPVVYSDFESIALSLGGFDRQLLTYYIDSLRERAAEATADERVVLERMVYLCEA